MIAGILLNRFEQLHVSASRVCQSLLTGKVIEIPQAAGEESGCPLVDMGLAEGAVAVHRAWHTVLAIAGSGLLHHQFVLTNGKFHVFANKGFFGLYLIGM